MQVPDALDAMIRLGANLPRAVQPAAGGRDGQRGQNDDKRVLLRGIFGFRQNAQDTGEPEQRDRHAEHAVPPGQKRGVRRGGDGHAGPGRDPEADAGGKACGRCHHLGIGRSHLEQLGTRENILRAKLEICEGLPQGAPLVVNGDDDYLPGAAVRPGP